MVPSLPPEVGNINWVSLPTYASVLRISENVSLAGIVMVTDQGKGLCSRFPHLLSPSGPKNAVPWATFSKTIITSKPPAWTLIFPHLSHALHLVVWKLKNNPDCTQWRNKEETWYFKTVSLPMKGTWRLTSLNRRSRAKTVPSGSKWIALWNEPMIVGRARGLSQT